MAAPIATRVRCPGTVATIETSTIEVATASTVAEVALEGVGQRSVHVVELIAAEVVSPGRSQVGASIGVQATTTTEVAIATTPIEVAVQPGIATNAIAPVEASPHAVGQIAAVTAVEIGTCTATDITAATRVEIEEVAHTVRAVVAANASTCPAVDVCTTAAIEGTTSAIAANVGTATQVGIAAYACAGVDIGPGRGDPSADVPAQVGSGSRRVSAICTCRSAYVAPHLIAADVTAELCSRLYAGTAANIGTWGTTDASTTADCRCSALAGTAGNVSTADAGTARCATRGSSACATGETTSAYASPAGAAATTGTCSTTRAAAGSTTAAAALGADRFRYEANCKGRYQSPCPSNLHCVAPHIAKSSVVSACRTKVVTVNAAPKPARRGERKASTPTGGIATQKPLQIHCFSLLRAEMPGCTAGKARRVCRTFSTWKPLCRGVRHLTSRNAESRMSPHTLGKVSFD